MCAPLYVVSSYFYADLWIAQSQIHTFLSDKLFWVSCLMMKFRKIENLLDMGAQY
jgi:hypothetical protein